VADEDANPLGRLQDLRMREALVQAIKNLPERVAKLTSAAGIAQGNPTPR
jgi:hypothetical protein